MDLTKEIDQLKHARQVFKLHTLSRQQVEHTLHRKLTDKACQAYVTSESRKLKKTKSQVYSIKRLFKEPKEKSKPKYTFSEIARHAAAKAQKGELRKPAEDFRGAHIFKSNKHDYKIEKVKEYKYCKFNSSRSEYKIYGDVYIFQVHKIM